MNEETVKKCNSCAPKGVTYSLQNGRPQVMVGEDFLKEEFGGQSWMEQAKALTEMMSQGAFGPEYQPGGSALQSSAALGIESNAGMSRNEKHAPTRIAVTTQPAFSAPRKQAPSSELTVYAPQHNYTSAELFGDILGSRPPEGGGIQNVSLAQTDAADVLPGESLASLPPKKEDFPDLSKGESLPNAEQCDVWRQTYHSSVDVNVPAEIWRVRKCFQNATDKPAKQTEAVNEAVSHLQGDGDVTASAVKAEMKKTIAEALGQGKLPWGITIDAKATLEGAIDGLIAEMKAEDPAYEPCFDNCPEGKICILKVRDVSRFQVIRIDPTDAFEVGFGDDYQLGNETCFDVFILATVVVHIDAVYTLSCDCVKGA